MIKNMDKIFLCGAVFGLVLLILWIADRKQYYISYQPHEIIEDVEIMPVKPKCPQEKKKPEKKQKNEMPPEVRTGVTVPAAPVYRIKSGKVEKIGTLKNENYDCIILKDVKTAAGVLYLIMIVEDGYSHDKWLVKPESVVLTNAVPIEKN